MQDSIKTWGDYNYFFTLDAKLDDSYGVCALIAMATNCIGLQIPISCTWKRVHGDRTYIVEGFSNVYQPSCDDLGATIYVAAQPLDSSEGFAGTAMGKFGPVELNPAL